MDYLELEKKFAAGARLPPEPVETNLSPDSLLALCHANLSAFRVARRILAADPLFELAYEQLTDAMALMRKELNS